MVAIPTINSTDAETALLELATKIENIEADLVTANPEDVSRVTVNINLTTRIATITANLPLTITAGGAGDAGGYSVVQYLEPTV